VPGSCSRLHKKLKPQISNFDIANLHIHHHSHQVVNTFRSLSYTYNKSPAKHYVVRRPGAHYNCSQRRWDDPRPLSISVLSSFIGTDQSQGRGQILSNINACLAVQGTIKSTLGPYGGDLLLVDSNGKQTITNDGATVMKVRWNDSLTRPR